MQFTTGQLSAVMEEGTKNLTEAVKNSAMKMSEATSHLSNSK